MNKFKFLLGAFAAVAFAACSSDEPGGGNPGNTDPENDVAYMTVNIFDVNSPSGKATSGDNDFEYGSTAENAVKSARFLFFDANKNFLLQASVWNGGKPNGANPDGNIEYFGNNVLVLENLKKTGYPTYLLVVLNAPANLTPVVGTTTIDDVRNVLCDVQNAAGNFIMTTSSYLKVNDEKFVYGADLLTTDNFKKTPYPAADDEPVDVYVERLAAKVRLNVSNELESKTFTEGPAAGLTGYRVPLSVSGNPNNEGGDDEGVTDIYVTFEGWGLSNFEPKSYLTKNLGVFGTPQFGSWYWNAPTFFRSWWAASPNYGQAEPELVRRSFDELTGEVGVSSLYIPETTNKFDNVQKSGMLTSKNVASILVKSFVRDSNGNPLSLVRYQGVYYKRTSFIAYALQTLAYNDELNFYTRVTTTEPGYTDGYKYTQVQKNEVTLVDREDTPTGVVMLASLFDADTTLYALNPDGTFSAIENGVAKLNAALGEFGKDSRPVAYTDGSQYYNIPIEHYAKATPSIKNVRQEGEYGVVRNHIYDVTITSISKLGGGIYDPGTGEEPGEPIIPDDPSDTYYLSAKINILSWKVVHQNVDL